MPQHLQMQFTGAVTRHLLGSIGASSSRAPKSVVGLCGALKVTAPFNRHQKSSWLPFPFSIIEAPSSRAAKPAVGLDVTASLDRHRPGASAVEAPFRWPAVDLNVMAP